MNTENDSPWKARKESDVSLGSNATKQTHRIRSRPSRIFAKTVSKQPLPVPTDDVSDVDSNATTLREFAKHCHRFGLDQFLSEYPFHFLIQETLMSRKADSGIQGTVNGQDTETSGPVDLFAALVYRLVQKAPSEAGAISIGRSSKNDIYISNSRISKVHAHFEKRGEDWYLIDNGSTNGTFLNGVELHPKQPYKIDVNSRICFSEDSAFRFLDNHRMCNHVKFFGHQIER
ncbi:MAG: FHA domain-containing protein [Planctomycetota bacterium]|nr:FHA domain-containing protein [Planctomycetota bacterium]